MGLFSCLPFVAEPAVIFRGECRIAGPTLCDVISRVREQRPTDDSFWRDERLQMIDHLRWLSQAHGAYRIFLQTREAFLFPTEARKIVEGMCSTGSDQRSTFVLLPALPYLSHIRSSNLSPAPAILSTPDIWRFLQT